MRKSLPLYPVPEVGDTVTLNDHGLNQCFGGSLGLSHMKNLEMKVIWVDSMSATYPDLTFPLDVDNSDIDKFLIDNRCFDIKTKDTK